MIAIKLRDFRGCNRAEIECAPIALVGGLNRAGKSSIAMAVGAALCGNALPVAGLSKSSGGLLVRTGASGAMVELRNDSGTALMSWPAGTTSTDGNPPAASEYAAGLSSIVNLSARDRARVLSDILRAEPTIDDLAAALGEKGWGRELVDIVWKLIGEQGWDGAHQVRKDRGAELKGRWRQITGATYGSRVAASWRPDLAELRENDLSAEIARARRDLDNAQSAAAVSHAEHERLIAEVNELDLRSGNALRADKAVEDASENLRGAQAARMALPPAEQLHSVSCPHCGGALVVRQVSLVETRIEKAEAIAEGDAKKRRTAIAEAEGRLANATDKLTLARNAAAAARLAVEAAETARERIANWPKTIEVGTDIEASRTALARAEKRLAEYRTKVEADDIHGKIESNEVLLDLLAGDGLRAKKLSRVLGVFVDRQLKALTDAAGWSEPVTIDADMAIALGGRPYGLLSGSEQYRVRAVLQVAIACIEGADLVVLDGADILDGPTRGGLFAMLDQAGLSALVCMTLSRREQMPNLAAAELGASYWLAGGVIEPLAQPREAAA